MRIFKIVLPMIIFIFLIQVSKSEELTKVEIPQIDPAVQGVWGIMGASKDKGSTFEDGNGEAWCRVFGTRVVLLDGSTLNVSRVYMLKERGIIYNVVYFENSDRFWVISKPKPPGILLQIFMLGTGNEVIRFVFIQKE